MNRPPVCVKCAIEMRPEKNGFKFVTMADFGPYQIWESDKWKCPVCNIEILAGWGMSPINEHYQEGFETVLETYIQEGNILKEEKENV